MLKKTTLCAFALLLTALVGCEGPQGEPGAAGAAGGQGIAGDDGDDGDNGLDGDDGADGEDGVDGDDGEDGEDGADLTLVENEACIVCHGDGREFGAEAMHTDAIALIDASDDIGVLDVDVVGNGTSVSVDFAFEVHYDDIAGNPIYVDPYTPRSNPAQLDYVRFFLARLVPGVDGSPDTWFDYATGERNVTGLSGDDGEYTYTFEDDFSADWDATATHRVGIQMYHLDDIRPVNEIYDFVPDGGDLRSHEVVHIDNCNSCHGNLTMHGGRVDTKMCVTCHNETMTDTIADFPVMIHQIHSAIDGNALWGFPADDHWDYSEVTFPQDTNNCRTCHSGSAEADNWMTVPNRKACGSCHTDVDFVTGTNHPSPGGIRLDDTQCTLCHGAAVIEGYHVSETVTTNNPELPAGQWAIDYELVEARVDGGNVLEIDFSIFADDVALDILAMPSDLTDEARYPDFLGAYAMAQGGIDAPADYNNMGVNAGSALSWDIGDLVAAGDVADAGGGVYTATIADAFPVGATMRAVALQSYFRQTNPAGGYWAAHTQSVQVPVVDDAVRRTVVDMAGCLGCHDALELHGGSRVNDPQVCVFCHNPSKSSGGRGADPAGLPQDTIDAVGADPLLFPEDTNNLKDMIHGLHGSEVREIEYEFVRNRAGGLYYNWAEVTFPRRDGTQECLACHLEGTYGAELVDGVLPSTVVTTDGINATWEDVNAARDVMPNDTDLVSSPTAAACYACHANEAAEAHMEQNGGIVREVRAESGL